MVNRFRPGSLVLLPPEHADAEAVLAAETARLQLQAARLGGERSGATADAPPAAVGSKRPRLGEATASAASEVAGGALTMSAAATAAADFLAQVPRPRFVYATVGGAIGAVLSLPPTLYVKLRLLQRSIARTVAPAGGLNHSTWRSW
jgi:hypothetical protein